MECAGEKGKGRGKGEGEGEKWVVYIHGGGELFSVISSYDKRDRLGGGEGRGGEGGRESVSQSVEGGKEGGREGGSLF